MRAYAILGNGAAPAGYHWFNFPWHVVNIWLVYELALLLLQRTRPAFFAAALWAVHPICTEAVTNVVGRADLLSVAAVLGGLLLYVLSTTMRGWRLGLAAVALFFIFPIASIMAERFLYLPAAAFAIALVALAYRARQQRLVPVFLAAAIALGACRTLAWNLAWQDDLTLSSTDVQAAPRSFDLHANLADTLFERDPRGNIDRAIGRYKGDLEGGMATAEGRVWYEKALAVLLRAREASRATENAYDAAQLAHGKPLRRRIGVPAVYFNLGAVCGVLGRYSEAIEAYRYGRSFDPASPEPYDALSAAHFGAGDPERAAIILVEKTQVDGFQPATMSTAVRGSHMTCAWPWRTWRGRLSKRETPAGRVTSRAVLLRATGVPRRRSTNADLSVPSPVGLWRIAKSGLIHLKAEDLIGAFRSQ